jgi:hypothetical protein
MPFSAIVAAEGGTVRMDGAQKGHNPDRRQNPISAEANPEFLGVCQRIDVACERAHRRLQRLAEGRGRVEV